MNPRVIPPLKCLFEINRLCDEFEAACRAGRAPRIEPYLGRAAAFAPALLEHLLPVDIEYRRRRGDRPTLKEYVERFPALDRRRLNQLLQRTEDPAFPSMLREYELLCRIGSGGMAVVYLARHRRMKRLVALKAIAPHAPERAALLQRFAREVEITARLSHPNVVAALDAREDQGIVYLVTRYLEGGDLGRLVRRKGPLSTSDVLRYARGAALGLAHAHARGVIHRDVKPSNLLLDGDGRVCVADWGLARTRTSGAGLSPLTATGTIVGTVDYLAPEQADESAKADARSDVYSLGCVLFFLFTGRAPFNQGTKWDRLDAHRKTPAPGLRAFRPDLRPRVTELVAKMLAKRPNDRPSNMEAVVAALDAASEPAKIVVPVAPERRSRGPSRRGLLWSVVAAGLLPATGFAIARALSPKKASEKSKPPPSEPPPIAEMPFADAAE